MRRRLLVVCSCWLLALAMASCGGVEKSAPSLQTDIGGEMPGQIVDVVDARGGELGWDFWQSDGAKDLKNDGAGPAGAPCEGDADCLTGLCVPGPDGSV